MRRPVEVDQLLLGRVREQVALGDAAPHRVGHEHLEAVAVLAQLEREGAVGAEDGQHLDQRRDDEGEAAWLRWLLPWLWFVCVRLRLLLLLSCEAAMVRVAE